MNNARPHPDRNRHCLTPRLRPRIPRNTVRALRPVISWASRLLLPLFPRREGGEGRGEEGFYSWAAPLSGSLPARASRGERENALPHRRLLDRVGVRADLKSVLKFILACLFTSFACPAQSAPVSRNDPSLSVMRDLIETYSTDSAA